MKKFISLLLCVVVDLIQTEEIPFTKGRKIEVISSKNYKSGINSINLDIKDLVEGIYYIKIQTNKKLFSRVFIKN
tara:strand:- start:272 stop:496 length:225 start_codon:yes stop_codon:yes gene_type:complete